MPNRDMGHMRKSYEKRSLSRAELDVDPIAQFRRWFNEACASEVYEPNAMALATVNALGRPVCRIVLLKGVDHGFIFYTNYRGAKGKQLAANPYVAATFWWDKLERQVRVEGKTEVLESTMSDDYFNNRPHGSQISAIVSPQSQVLESYQQLRELRDRYRGAPVRPDYWGGYRIIPSRLEFWQGRANRLHDRFEYGRQTASSRWIIQRLAP